MFVNSTMATVMESVAELIGKIRNRAGAKKNSAFVYGHPPDKVNHAKTPDEMLRGLCRDDGFVQMGCYHFIIACLALGMPSNYVIDQKNTDETIDMLNGDQPITPPRMSPDQRDRWRSWLHAVLPGVGLAYIGDIDLDLYDFWQRCNINFTGHWVIVVRGGQTVSMTPDGVVIRPLEYWYDYIYKERLKEVKDGFTYSGPTRTPEFIESVFSRLSPNGFTVYTYF